MATSRTTVKALSTSRPRRSTGSAAARALAGSRLQPTAAAPTATGRFAANTARHPSVLTSTAASAGPPIPMIPQTEDMSA